MDRILSGRNIAALGIQLVEEIDAGVFPPEGLVSVVDPLESNVLRTVGKAAPSGVTKTSWTKKARS